MNFLSFAIMDISQAQAWVILISAVTAAAISIITAFKSKSNGAKLDVIHQLTNSNLTAVKADLVMALKDINFLKEYISKNAKAPDPSVPTPEFIAKIEIAPPPTVPREPPPVLDPFPGSPFPPPPVQPPKQP